MAVATAVLVAGCTAGQASTPDAGEAPPEAQVKASKAESVSAEERESPAGQARSTAEPESEDIQGTVSTGVAPDYANDAGENLQVYDYPDDPEPAESIVATLCNLNRDYITSLRPTADGLPVVDDSLRTMLVAFSDYLGHWDTLRPHYAEAVEHIDTAQAVYDLWDQAMLAQDNGDPDAAQSAMLQAEELLSQLPTGEMNVCTTE